MRAKKERRIFWLFAGFLSVSFLGFITRTYLPESAWMVLLFLAVVALAVFSFTYYMTVSARVSILAASGIAVWLFLRYSGLREPIFPLLLLASLVSIDLYFRKK